MLCEDYIMPGFFEDDILEEDPPEPETDIAGLSNSDIDRWSSWIRPFPLPSYLTPSGEIDWEDVTDDTLMNAPPHVIVHLQRTAAQGGLQVVSPRQTPMTSLLGRVGHGNKEIGDYVVGSVADVDPLWPTIDGDDMDDWLPDEPLPTVGAGASARHKTKTEGLTSASHLMSDPILACLIKGRATVDIVRRDDVAGDPDGLSKLLADAWSVPVEDFMEMDAFTIGIDGPLLRHAIKVDDVYPMVHAPIHHKLSVSVSYSEVSREVLPCDSAMDWRRMRVFAEAVYLMSAAVEGFSITKARVSPPPGDPSAPIDRKGILAFRPLPCSAWSAEPRSFSIVPVISEKTEPTGEIPREVLMALSRYVSEVKPVSYAMLTGHRAVARQSVLVEPEVPPDETITNNYGTVVRTIKTGGARGKTAAATVRNVIFDAIEAAPMNIRMRLARYLHITRSEVETHLNSPMITEGMSDKMAMSFMAVGDMLRAKIASEAARRGSTVEEWWLDITSQAPDRYKEMNEGTMGWARVGMWLTFKEPTERWTNLTKAVHYSAMRQASIGSVEGIPLPPIRGSAERALEAARAVVKESTTTFGSYYMAVADVAFAIADEHMLHNRQRSGDIMREAAYLWVLRARCLRGTNVHLLTKTEPMSSHNHLRVYCDQFDLAVVPAPYRAFEAYRSHLKDSNVIHKVARQKICDFKGSRLSDMFSQMDMPLAPVGDSVTTRYIVTPSKLGSDIEEAWNELVADVRQAVKMYAEEPMEASKSKKKQKTIDADDLVIDFSQAIRKPVEGQYKYIDLLILQKPDTIDWYEDVLAEMDPVEAALLTERTYKDIKEMRKVFLGVEEKLDAIKFGDFETVQ